MSNFEVGDRVVVVKNNHPTQDKVLLFQRGTVMGITDAEEFEVRVFLASGGFIYFDSAELELEGVYDALSAPHPDEFSSDTAKVDTRDGDAVSHPSHYTSHPSGIECKDIIGHYPFFIGSAMKYLWRAGLKEENPIEDLRKAVKNIEFEIERLGGTVG